MKILFLTTHLNVGGVSTYVVTLSQYVRRKGIDVCCASSGGTLVTELEQLGIKHYTVPIKTKNELDLKLLFSLGKILEIVDDEQITLIHAHTRVAQVLGMAVRRLRPTVKLITTCHGFFKRRLFRRLFPAWGDCVVAISDPVREHLVNDFKVPKAMVRLVHNGVEPEKFDVVLSDADKQELRRYYHIGEGGLVVGGVSRLEKLKGYQSLIRAVPRILEHCPDAKFVLIGDGKYKKKLQELAVRMNVQDKVVFAGKVEDVGVALQLIDVFVLPSVSSEGFGLAVLEAMAARKPIIVSNMGGVYALVKEDVNGWLLPPGDVEALAHAIIKLLEAPELRKRMGDESWRIARETFSMTRMADEMIEVYNDVATHA